MSAENDIPKHQTISRQWSHDLEACAMHPAAGIEFGGTRSALRGNI